MLGSVAVIVGAIVIHFTDRTIVDPVLAVLIGLWVLPRTWTLLQEAVHILLNGVPGKIDLEKVRTALTQDVGVTEIYDLHVWSLGSRRVSLRAHVVAAEGVDADALRGRMRFLRRASAAI